MAVLYCFLNGEVRTEVTRVIKNQRLLHFHTKWVSRHSTHSNSTCSCNPSKVDKHSKRSRWWKAPWLYFLNDRTARRSTHSMASIQGVLSILSKLPIFNATFIVFWYFSLLYSGILIYPSIILYILCHVLIKNICFNVERICIETFCKTNIYVIETLILIYF